MTTLPILFGYNISGLGNSSVPYWLGSYWNRQQLQTQLYSPSCTRNAHDKFLRPLLGSIRRKLAYRFNQHLDIRDKTEKFFFERNSANRYVYLWAGLSLEIFERFHANGNKIILERINCHQATAREQVNRAHTEQGLAPPENITNETIAEENRKLELASAVFTPSPMVYKSMVDNGVDEHKLIPTSYGWSTERFNDLDAMTQEKPTFVFVGTLCVRKGVPLLLKAWRKANIDGRLIFCGQMDATIKTHYGHYFEQDDIIHAPYTPDLREIYKSADGFVFPSYEEGGPMVTYEAMAHGAVPLVSEMGAGAIVEHRNNGLILDLDVDSWATAIMAIAGNRKRRLELSYAARNRAQEFTWQKVAAQRADALQQKFPDLWQ